MNAARHGLRIGLLCIALGLAACAAKETDPRIAKFAQLPDWSGIWVSAELIGKIDINGYPAMDDPLHQWKVLGFSAPFNEAGKAALGQFMAHAERVSTTKSAGWSFPRWKRRHLCSLRSPRTRR